MSGDFESMEDIPSLHTRDLQTRVVQYCSINRTQVYYPRGVKTAANTIVLPFYQYGASR
jgi:hypothetical protein